MSALSVGAPANPLINDDLRETLLNCQAAVCLVIGGATDAAQEFSLSDMETRALGLFSEMILDALGHAAENCKPAVSA